MAINKMMNIKSYSNTNPHFYLKNAIDYICKLEKTDNGKNIFATNCSIKNTVEDFLSLKKSFGKLNSETKNGKKDRQAYHFVISFSPNEKINPALCNEITQEFIDKYLKNEYQVIFATHTDTDHVHSHFIFNSVNMINGLKYHYSNGQWKKEILPILNELCKKYSLKELNIKPYGEREFSFKENSSYTSRIKKEIDDIIKNVSSVEALFSEMKNRGYQIYRRGKNINIKAPAMSSARRLNTLGEGYTEEDLIKRISDNKILDNTTLPMYKNSKVDFYNKKNFTKKISKITIECMTVTVVGTLPYSKLVKHKKEFNELQETLDLFSIIKKQNINSSKDVDRLLEKSKTGKVKILKEKEKVISELKSLQNLNKINEEIEYYSDAHKEYLKGNNDFAEEDKKYSGLIKQLEENGYTTKTIKEKIKKLSKEYYSIKTKEKNIKEEEQLLKKLFNKIEVNRKRAIYEKMLDIKYREDRTQGKEKQI